MHFDSAVIREQGLTFAIAIVWRSVLRRRHERDQAIAEFSVAFEGLPTILMAQDSRGVPEHYGRQDLVNFMASVPLDAVPWQRYWLQ